MRRPGAIRFAAFAAASTILAAALPAPDVGAGQAFVSGSGRADARIIRVGPSAGRLSLAPSVGLALADYRGMVARAEARALDYAALADSVHSLEEDLGEPVLTEDLYPSVRAESTGDRGGSGQNPPFTQQATATDRPEGRAKVLLATFEIPGVVRVSAGRAESFAGVVEIEAGRRKLRHAGGTVVVGRVELGDGAVILRDLTWEVVQITDRNDDPDPQVRGAFVIGSATIGDETHEGPIRGADLLPLFERINAALAASGVRVAAPRVQESDAVGRITPLAVRVVDSEIGKSLIAPVLGAAQPAREEVVGDFLEACPQCAPLVLVADVTVGVFSGANRFDVEVGGAVGFTEGETFTNPFSARFGEHGDRPSRRVTTFEEERLPTEVPLGEEQDSGRDAAVQAPRAAGLDGPGGRGVDRLDPAPSWLWALVLVGLLTAAGVGLAQHRRIRAAHRAALVAGGS